MDPTPHVSRWLSLEVLFLSSISFFDNIGYCVNHQSHWFGTILHHLHVSVLIVFHVLCLGNISIVSCFASMSQA